MSKLLVCGSRKLHGVDFTKHLLPICNDYDVDVIITGGAVGVDRDASNWASRWLIKTETVKPDYAEYGRQAPVIRDKQMVDMCDACVAFWDGFSRGTEHTINFAKESNKPYVVFICNDSGKVVNVG